MDRVRAVDPTAGVSMTASAIVARAIDLLVVGGGITGAGTGRVAATRGLRVAMVGPVREALRQRAIPLRIAPHLVRLEPSLVPIYGSPPDNLRVGSSISRPVGPPVPSDLEDEGIGPPSTDYGLDRLKTGRRRATWARRCNELRESARWAARFHCRSEPGRVRLPAHAG